MDGRILRQAVIDLQVGERSKNSCVRKKIHAIIGEINERYIHIAMIRQLRSGIMNVS